MPPTWASNYQDSEFLLGLIIRDSEKLLESCEHSLARCEKLLQGEHNEVSC